MKIYDIIWLYYIDNIEVIYEIYSIMYVFA